MKRFLYFVLLLMLVALSAKLLAQDSLFMQSLIHKHKGDPIFDIQFNYTYQFPDGDLAKRFGNLHNIGVGGLYKSKSKWIIAGEVAYQFGDDVKESNILYNLTNSNGQIMNVSGMPATYFMTERGLSTFIKGGKMFVLSHRHPNSGILITAGCGYLMHKININTPTNDIPGLTEDLKPGYDRLTGGFALTQFVGYIFHSHNRYVNFYVGFDFVQAFTKSIRGYNYDQMQYDTEKRNDYTNGIRLGWMIPLYLSASYEDEFDFR